MCVFTHAHTQEKFFIVLIIGHLGNSSRGKIKSGRK